MDFFIARYSSSKCKKRLRKVRKIQKILIERVEEALEKAAQFVAWAERSSCDALTGVAERLKGYLPAMRQAASVARRAGLRRRKGSKPRQGVQYLRTAYGTDHPRSAKRPIEFGHKVLLTQSKEKFITDYVVLEENCTDDQLLPTVIERHEEKYGRVPESVAADKGFCPDADTYEELEEQVEYLRRAAPDPRFRGFAHGRLANSGGPESRGRSRA